MLQSVKTCGKCKRAYNGENDFMRDTSQWRLSEEKHLFFNCSCGSTIMLPEGKYEWYSPAKIMSPEAATLFNKLSILGTLPHIPSAIMKIQTLLQDESTQPGVLAAAILKEPLIASTLLRTATNIKFARTGDKAPIDSIEHAIAYVGLDMLSQVVLMASVKSFKIQTKIFTSEIFWEEAFSTGHFATVIGARHAAHVPKDHVYLAATLANIGKIVAGIVDAPAVDDTYAFLNDPKTLCTWRAAEKRTQKFPHNILGEVGGAIWGFPKYVLEAARFHHEPQSHHLKAPTGSLTLIEVVALGINLSHWARLEPTRMDRDLMLQIAGKVGLKEGDLANLVEDFRAKATLN